MQQQAVYSKLKETATLFDHDYQIGLSAKLLEFIRDDLLKDEWSDLRLVTPTKPLVHGREKKNVIKALIRISSESRDYQKTVDFVTKNALERMRINNRGTVTFEKGLSHEHMVPCEVVFARTNTLPSDESDLSFLMKRMGFRALIDRAIGDVTYEDGTCLSEHACLEKQFHDKMPEWTSKASNFPAEFLPFARYEAVGIFDRLLPVTERGESLLAAYRVARESCWDATKKTWTSK